MPRLLEIKLRDNSYIERVLDDKTTFLFEYENVISIVERKENETLTLKIPLSNVKWYVIHEVENHESV